MTTGYVVIKPSQLPFQQVLLVQRVNPAQTNVAANAPVAMECHNNDESCNHFIDSKLYCLYN